MQKILILVALLLCASMAKAACSNTTIGSSSFKCVTSQTSATGAGLSQSVTFSGGYAAGSLIVVLGEQNNANVNAPMLQNYLTNTALYTWSWSGNCYDQNTGTSRSLAFWWTYVSTLNSSSDTITLAVPVSNQINILAAVYSGSSGASETGVCNPLGSSNAVATGNYTVTNGDLVIGGQGNNYGAATATTGTERLQVLSHQYSTSDIIASSTTANMTWSLGASGTWAAIGVAFRPASGAPTMAGCDVSDACN